MHLVNVRFFGELVDVSSFVQPNHPEVMKLANQLGSIEACYSWVTREVRYPSGKFPDFHKIQAFQRGGFISRPIYSQVVEEYWCYPSEVLAAGKYFGEYWGDCEDSSNLLISMVRSIGIPPQQAYVALGTIRGYGHAWAYINGLYYETTFDFPVSPKIPGYPYNLKGMFNDVESIEFEEGYYGIMGDAMESANEPERFNILQQLYGIEPKLDNFR